MTITGVFIRRPVATTILMAGILVFGIMGYRNLAVSNLPNVDFPTIQVSAVLPGASPDTMASAVATPLEKQFSTISSLDNMTSTSSQGSTQIVLQFSLERDIDAAAQDVQTAIGKAIRQLPQEIQMPTYQKVNPADMPIIMYALTSSTLPLSALDEYGQTLLAQNISMIQGVAQVQVYGSQKYAVRIQLDPKAIASKGISIDKVAQAVMEANENLPTGTLWGTDRLASIETNAQLQTAKEFQPIIVGFKDGAIVRLQDIGSAKDDVQNNKVAAWFKDERGIILAVQRQPGSNTVEVADNVRKLVDSLRKRLPESVKVQVLYDRSISIRESVRDVKVTLSLTLILVVLVIFLFLRNVSATIIPSLALPLSIVGTFAMMFLLGYTLDNLSLMALTLALGFVVDDAVVMLENIFRHMEQGKTRLQAALEGAKQIEFTILSMTLSLVAVFIPILLMGGIIGRLFREFAVTISIAILTSGLVALTLSPMMCSLFLRSPKEVYRGRMYMMTEKIWVSFLHFYERTLAWVMNHRREALVFSAFILIGTVWLFIISPKGFLPNEDIGMLMGVTETAEGTSFDSMVRHQKAAAAILKKDPNIDGFMSSVGSGGGSSLSNQGRFFIQLKSRKDRKLSADDVIQSLRPKLSKIPGIRVFLQIPPSIRIGGQATKALYQYTIQSTDTKTLYDVVPALEAELRNAPSLQDVNSDLLLKNPQVVVQINRDKASSLGISAHEVEQTLSLAYSSSQISTIYTPTNQYWVIMELLPEYQMDPSALNLIYVQSATGSLVPLSTLATIVNTVGPMSINHSGQIPSATISFNLKPGAALSEAVDAVEKTAKRILPSNVVTNFVGTAQAFKGSQSNLGLLLILAILVIYMILGILYESFIHPLTILTGLPFAGFGALLTLYIFKVDLSVYAFVGIIMLIGVVKKNAIMMIDFAIEAQHQNNLTAKEAILQAASIRFRPIMMTTMAAFMGTLPIALGLGAGGEARQPLGLAVVGGLAFSQFVTLYVTPVFYTYLDRLQKRQSARLKATTE